MSVHSTVAISISYCWCDVDAGTVGISAIFIFQNKYRRAFDFHKKESVSYLYEKTD